MSSLALKNDTCNDVTANNAAKVIKKPSKDVTASKPAKVIKKPYVLNELDAMRKKLNFQHRNPSISIEGEAKNGSTININVKTSLFEYTKARLIEELVAIPEILETEQTATATAPSKHSGIAEVEYQLECLYRVNDFKHKVKITCYTTTCKITITNMGEASEVKSHLENK